MNKSLLVATLAANLALVAALPTVAAELRSPLDPTAGVVLISTTLQGGEGAGSGMVLTRDGQVLTNYHVVEGSTQVAVTDPSTGRSYTATVVGHDASADVALLQLAAAPNLTPVTLDDDTVRVGDAVTAIGNASGGGELVSSPGEVTALEQDITVGKDGGGSEDLLGVIETTAGAVPGDSGGAMVDAEGEVVGMTTAGEQRAMRGRGGEGRQAVTTASYAVPIEDALAVVERIRAGQETDTTRVGARAYLGLSVVGSRSLLVGSIVADGPAATAGVTEGSEITGIDGTQVSTHADLAAALAGLDPEQRVELVWVDSDGVRHAGTVTLGSNPVN